jgi:TonB family protein
MVADGVKGTTIVTVSLAADSTVSSATISTSSGNLALDRAALQAARASRYSAPIENCRQQAGQLNIVEEFR